MIVLVLIGLVITIHLSAISRPREAQRMTDGGPWPQPRCGACCLPPQDCQREDSCRSGQSNPALWPHLHLHQHLHVRSSLRTLQLRSGLAGQYRALHCTPPRAPTAAAACEPMDACILLQQPCTFSIETCLPTHQTCLPPDLLAYPPPRHKDTD